MKKWLSLLLILGCISGLHGADATSYVENRNLTKQGFEYVRKKFKKLSKFEKGFFKNQVSTKLVSWNIRGLSNDAINALQTLHDGMSFDEYQKLLAEASKQKSTGRSKKSKPTWSDEDFERNKMRIAMNYKFITAKGKQEGNEKDGNMKALFLERNGFKGKKFTPEQQDKIKEIASTLQYQKEKAPVSVGSTGGSKYPSDAEFDAVKYAKAAEYKKANPLFKGMILKGKINGKKLSAEQKEEIKRIAAGGATSPSTQPTSVSSPGSHADDSESVANMIASRVEQYRNASKITDPVKQALQQSIVLRGLTKPQQKEVKRRAAQGATPPPTPPSSPEPSGPQPGVPNARLESKLKKIPETDTLYGKYAKMLRVGMSFAAVSNRMNTGGVWQQFVAYKLPASGGGSAQGATPPSTPPTSPQTPPASPQTSPHATTPPVPTFAYVLTPQQNQAVEVIYNTLVAGDKAHARFLLDHIKGNATFAQYKPLVQMIADGTSLAEVQAAVAQAVGAGSLNFHDMIQSIDDFLYPTKNLLVEANVILHQLQVSIAA